MKTLHVLGALLAFTTACFAVMLPVPSGPYHVGVRRYIQRLEVEHSELHFHHLLPNITTEYMLTVYYPTNEKSQPKPYLQPGLTWRTEKAAPQLHYDIGKLDTVLAHLTWNASYLETEGKDVPDTPVGPTIFYDGRLRWPPSDGQTALLSDLASHGYTVAAVDHPTEAIYLKYPNGEEKLSFSNFNEKWRHNQHYYPSKIYPWAQHQIHQLASFRRNNVTSNLLTIWPDLVDEWQAPFAKDNIGLLGYEMGGSTGLDLSSHPMVSALAMMAVGQPYGYYNPLWGFWDRNTGGRWRGDSPTHLEDLVKQGIDIKVPLLHFGSCLHNTKFIWVEDLFPRSWFRWFCIQDSGPFDFTDMAIWKKFMNWKQTEIGRWSEEAEIKDSEEPPIGPIDGDRVHELTCRLVRAFFDRMIRPAAPYDPILEEKSWAAKDLKLVRASFTKNPLTFEEDLPGWLGWWHYPVYHYREDYGDNHHQWKEYTSGGH